MLDGDDRGLRRGRDPTALILGVQPPSGAIYTSGRYGAPSGGSGRSGSSPGTCLRDVGSAHVDMRFVSPEAFRPSGGASSAPSTSAGRTLLDAGPGAAAPPPRFSRPATSMTPGAPGSALAGTVCRECVTPYDNLAHRRKYFFRSGPRGPHPGGAPAAFPSPPPDRWSRAGDEAPAGPSEAVLRGVCGPPPTLLVVRGEDGTAGPLLNGSPGEAGATWAKVLIAVLPPTPPDRLGPIPGSRRSTAVRVASAWVGGPWSRGIASGYRWWLRRLAPTPWRSLLAPRCLGLAATDRRGGGRWPKTLGGHDLPWGSPLIHTPGDPELEEALVGPVSPSGEVRRGSSLGVPWPHPWPSCALPPPGSDHRGGTARSSDPATLFAKVLRPRKSPQTSWWRRHRPHSSGNRVAPGPPTGPRRTAPPGSQVASSRHGGRRYSGGTPTAAPSP